MTIKFCRDSTYQDRYIMFDVLYQINVHHTKCDVVTWCRERFGDTDWRFCTPHKDIWESTNDRWGYISSKDGILLGFNNESDYMEFCLRCY